MSPGKTDELHFFIQRHTIERNLPYISLSLGVTPYNFILYRSTFVQFIRPTVYKHHGNGKAWEGRESPGRPSFHDT